MIMNKKIGKYLEKLRKANEFTQEELALRIKTTRKSIIDWEGDKAMPSTAYLVKLAQVLKTTIDDILMCGKSLSEEDLYTKYRLFAPIQFKIEHNRDLFTSFQSQTLLVYKRFKKLLFTFNETILSKDEETETRFLFSHMCSMTKKYFEDFDDDNQDSYFSFIKLLSTLKTKHLNNEEFYYEACKYFKISNSELANTTPHSFYGYDDLEKIKDEQFKALEDWEKDKYLAYFQNNDVIPTIARIDDYERIYHAKYNKEEAVKNLMKYFISRGACLNSIYFTYKKKAKKEYDILTTLENFYLNYSKPLLISYYPVGDEDCEEKLYAYLENNDFTRFIYDHYEELYTDPRLLYRLVKEDIKEEELVELLFEEKHKSHFEDKEMSYERKQTLVWHYMQDVEKLKNTYKSETEFFETMSKKKYELEEELRNKKTVYYDYYFEDIIEYKDFSHLSAMEGWRSLYSYEDYLKHRDEVKTKELLDEIDSLSLKDIRNKYFPKEVYEV